MPEPKRVVAFHAVLALIVASFVLGALRWGFQAKALPLFLGAITLVLAILVTVLTAVRPPKSTKAQPGEEPLPLAELGKGAAWLALLFALVVVTGFYLGPALFGAAFALVKRMGWVALAAYAVLLPLAIWAVFTLALKLSLWPGALPTIVPHLVGGGILPPL